MLKIGYLWIVLQKESHWTMKRAGKGKGTFKQFHGWITRRDIRLFNKQKYFSHVRTMRQ